MLKGVVRQPLSPPGGRATTMTKNGVDSASSAAAAADRRPRKRSDHHHEGRDEVLPLVRRPILRRLDVYPFLIGYLALALLDAHHHARRQNDDDDDGPPVAVAPHLHPAAVAILIDLLYVALLVSQLAVFLKCQWDPMWHAKIAYRRYIFQPLPSSSADAEAVAERKIRDMKTWTHCLIVPPNPYDRANNGPAPSKGAAAQTVRPERPGIVPLSLEVAGGGGGGGGPSPDDVVTSFVATILFRGWTYRCCVNVKLIGSTGIMVEDEYHGNADLPMESIWQNRGGGDPLLEEISDGELDGDEMNKAQSSAAASSDGDGTSTFWKPQFHRLNFPIDLPLPFYRRWQGHDRLQQWQGRDGDSASASDSSGTTLQSARRIYGINQTLIPLPPLLSLLTQQLLQPMFLFQLLCVALWSLDEYWIYAVFTLMTLLAFEAVQAFTRHRNVKRLREEVSGNGAEQQRVECYRMGEWTALPTNRLVVGDIVSMTSPSVHNQQRGQRTNAVRNVHDHAQGCAIPADLLLLNGRAVVNEAMLTGESVPQVKESIEIGEGGGGGKGSVGKGDAPALDLSDGSTHRRSVLFGGTVLMDHHSGEERDGDDDHADAPRIPSPPDGGLACFVLRTGFDTVQGQLLRTLAYHAESGSGGNAGGGEGVNAGETLCFLLLLLLCALASAGSVLRHAWGDITRNHFKLVLHVVIIITSVIPPELPMELSLAVTTSLGELIKRYNVYCTEPFRIPLAGLVDTCCFDKTGTLTSDELRLHGVRLPDVARKTTNEAGGTANDGKDDADLILFDDILSKSKISSDDDDEAEMNSGGDVIRSLLPREMLRVMVGCQSLAVTHVFVPGKGGRTMVQTELCGDPLEKVVMEGCGFTIHPKTNLVVEKESVAPTSRSTSSLNDGGSIKVLHRFAFSSKLRRMTVLALDTTENDGTTKNTNTTLWALTKGAPEALKPMLDPESLPADYEQSYLRHMTLGRRVLALAHRRLGENANSKNALAGWKSSRDEVERKMTFAGLLVMDSPLKADSARVVKELRAGNQKVVMVTGDAVLTAAEVARRVGIVDATQDRTYELLCPDGGREGREGQLAFRPLDHSIGTKADGDGEGELLRAPLSELEAMAREGRANFCVTGDVLTKLAIRAVEGATAAPAASTVPIDEHAALAHPAAKAFLSEIAPVVSVFARHAPRHKEAVVAALNAAGRHTLMCGDGTNDVGALKAAHVGVSIVSVPDLERKQRGASDAIGAARAEERRERKRASKKRKENSEGVVKKPKSRSGRAGRIEKSLQTLREAEDELNFVGLGNASVASPFTSRKTSIRCCKDILQQGRCTLVTMIQIYKILGVQCLVNALVLTKLHQKGVKQGDRQLTAVGVVVSVLFLFVTRGKPLQKLSTQKPPSSVMSKEILLSMIVQFGIHFAAIMAVTFVSDAYVDPYDPSIVPDGRFHPNTLNTATFLVTVLATINAFLVNYRGRPFMEDLRENRLLFRGIQGCYFVLFACATEVFPPLNQLLQLSPLPSFGPPLFHIHDEGHGGYDEFGVVHDLLLQSVTLVGFRTMLCVIMCLDTALVTLAEKTIRSVLEA